MATKTVICLLLLTGSAVWGQTAITKEIEDNRSQLPIVRDVEMVKGTTPSLVAEPLNGDEIVIDSATQANPADSNKIAAVLTTEKVDPLVDSDVISTNSPLPVKPEEEHQNPIFLNQHIFSAIDKQLAAKKDVQPVEEVDITTEAIVDAPAKSDVASHHDIPAFPGEGMVQGIINMHNAEKKDLANKVDKDQIVDKSQPGPTEIALMIPEPKEHYKNHLYIYGHHHESNVHSHLMLLVSSAMTQELSYGSNRLTAYPLSTSYELTSNGLQVTHIEYVVTYNGRVLAEYEVTHTLSRPVPSTYFHQGLDESHLSQHFAAEGSLPPTSAPSTQKTSFAVPVIVAVSTLVVVALLLTVVLVVYIKRNRSSPPKSKDKKQLMKYILKTDKTMPRQVEPIKPPPYTENPTYEV